MKVRHKDDRPVDARYCFPLNNESSVELVFRGWLSDHPLTKAKLNRLRDFVDLMIEALSEDGEPTGTDDDLIPAPVVDAIRKTLQEEARDAG